jgi:glucose/arabinose dehydrogenase
VLGAVGGHDAQARGAVLQLRPVAKFDLPMYMAVAPGDRTHLFVLERAGLVKVVNRDGTNKQTVLNISSRVNTNEDGGLMGIAFPPNYQQSHRFYLYYSDQPNHDVVVDEYRTTAGDPLHASPSTRRNVIRILHREHTDHYGGTLQFDPNGRLYISVGDGGCCNDPEDNARHLNNLLGKIVRINPLPANGQPYTVPSANPFVGKNGRDEIYSYGLRNPFRFSFDRKTGRIAIGDVGQDQYEEIDYTTLAGANGANFGWPQFEGFTEIDPGRPALGPPVDPIFAYPHGDPGGGAAFGCAVIGGYVVRAPDLPSLAGQYVYSDNCTGDIRALQPTLGGATGDHSLGLNAVAPAAFGEGPSGQIYIASLGGTLYRLAQAP